MQTKSAPAPTSKGALKIVIVIVVVGLIAALFVHGSSNSENDVPILHTDQDYSDTMIQIQKLTSKEFLKPDDAQLSRDEQHDLRVAALKVQGLIAYKPEIFSNYFIAGKIAFLLQDYPTAQSQFLQCLAVPWIAGEDKTFFTQTGAEAHYMLSRCFFLQTMYQKAADEAAIAVKAEPQSVLYRMADARAETQMGHDAATRKLLSQVLQIEPNNEEAIQLLRLISDHPESPKKTPGSSTGNSSKS